MADVDMAVGVGQGGSDEDAMAHGGDGIDEIGGGATEGGSGGGGVAVGKGCQRDQEGRRGVPRKFLKFFPSGVDLRPKAQYYGINADGKRQKSTLKGPRAVVCSSFSRLPSVACRQYPSGVDNSSLRRFGISQSGDGPCLSRLMSHKGGLAKAAAVPLGLWVNLLSVVLWQFGWRALRSRRHVMWR
jgi:hypothetical protein